MLKATSGQTYPDLRSLTAGELQAGRMSRVMHDQIVGYHNDLQTAVAAFDISGILTALLNLLPLISIFVPALAPFAPIVAAAVPIIQNIIQVISTGGSVTQLWTQLQALLQQVFGNLPKPVPGPTPAPLPPIPQPTPPGPSPVPIPSA